MVNKAATTITGQAATVAGSGATRTVTFKATLTSSVTGLALSGQTITFTLNTTGSPTVHGGDQLVGRRHVQRDGDPGPVQRRFDATAPASPGQTNYLSGTATEPA